MNRFCISLALFAFLLVQTTWAASQTDLDFNAGRDALNGSNPANSIPIFEKIVTGFPTYPLINNVKVNLGLAYLITGKYKEASDVFQKLVDIKPPVEETIREPSLFFLGQAQYSIAVALPPADASRKKGLETAVATYSKHIEAYPKSANREDALYNRGLAYYLLQTWDSAEKDLQMLVNSYAQSPNVADYYLWLGISYSTRGSLLQMDKKTEAQAKTYIDKAIDVFGKISGNNLNPVVANDAMLQRADLLVRMSNSPEDTQKAIDMYRKVLPKDELIPLQDQRIKEINTKRIEAVKANNQDLQENLDRQRRREQGRMIELQSRPDAAVQSLVQISRCFLRLQDFDESRALGRRALNFATDEQKKTIRYTMILSYAFQKKTDKANAGMDAYQKDFPNDPDADNLAYLIGSGLLERAGTITNAEAKKDAYQAAFDMFARGLKDYPKGRYADASSLRQATAMVGLGKYDEAARVLSEFVTKNPQSPLVPEATFSLASAQRQLKKLDDAIKNFRAVATNPKAEGLQANAAYLVADTLSEAGKADEAIVEYKSFAEKYPQNEFVPYAFYKVGFIQEQKKDYAAAIATFQSIVDKYPRTIVGPASQEKIAALYGAQKKPVEMIAALRKLIELFPQDPKAGNAFFSIAKYHEDRKEWDEAAKAYGEASRQPNSKNAPQAQLNLVLMWQKLVKAQGRYSALSPEERKQWQEYTDKQEASAKDVLTRFPASNEAGSALSELVKLALIREDAGLLKGPELEAYFTDLAKQFPDPAVKARIMLAQAAVPYEKGDTARSLKMINEILATNPGAQLSSDDYNRLASAQLAAKDYAASAASFKKLETTYQDPFAQANATYGQGAALLAQGKVTEADVYFDKLEKAFPWSEKIMDAKYGRALAAENKGDLETATKNYLSVHLSPRSSAEMKGRSLFAYAQVLEKQGKTVAPAGTTEPNALNNFIKVDDFYGEAQPALGAEALYRAAQIQQQKGMAVEAEKTKTLLKQKYPKSEWATK